MRQPAAVSEVRAALSRMRQPAAVSEVSAFMRQPAALVAPAATGWREGHSIFDRVPDRPEPQLYADAQRDLDVCVACFEKMTPHARTCIGNLLPYTFERRGFSPSEITCDFCSRNGTTF